MIICLYTIYKLIEEILKFTFMPDVVFFNCKLLLESSFLQLDTYSIQKILVFWQQITARKVIKISHNWMAYILYVKNTY